LEHYVPRGNTVTRRIGPFIFSSKPTKEGNFRDLRRWQAFILVRPIPEYETQSWNVQTVPYKQ